MDISCHFRTTCHQQILTCLLYLFHKKDLLSGISLIFRDFPHQNHFHILLPCRFQVPSFPHDNRWEPFPASRHTSLAEYTVQVLPDLVDIRSTFIGTGSPEPWTISLHCHNSVHNIKAEASHTGSDRSAFWQSCPHLDILYGLWLYFFHIQIRNCFLQLL